MRCAAAFLLCSLLLAAARAATPGHRAAAVLARNLEVRGGAAQSSAPRTMVSAGSLQLPAGRGRESEAVEDYRSAGGLRFPFRFMNQPDAVDGVILQIGRMVLNRTLDPAVFRFPKPSA